MTRTDGKTWATPTPIRSRPNWSGARAIQFEGKFLADYTKADENGSPLVFAAYTETAAFGAWRAWMLAALA